MKLLLYILNLVFLLLNHRVYRSFLAPGKLYWRQQEVLLGILQKNQNSDLGLKLGFGKISSVAEYQQSVSPNEYEFYRPCIRRIMDGQKNVLTCDEVRNLVPTSGTTSCSKYIPFTTGLKNEFSRAVNVWIYDLIKSYPKLRWGRQFWIVTPQTQSITVSSKIKIGFESDSSYFGKLGRWLISRIKVLPDELAQISNEDNYKYALSYFMLTDSNLRLISVWNPTLLTMICDYIKDHLNFLIEDIASGKPRLPRPDITGDSKLINDLRMPRSCLRAQYIRKLAESGDFTFCDIWPDLVLISCWTDAWADKFIPAVKKQFPGVPIQGKGLLATEAAVTIPLHSAAWPLLAYNAHFYEFRNEQNDRIYLAHELVKGQSYQVLVTTSGGLYRYQLHDLVRVEGFYRGIPMLRFLGKSDATSDLTGEKLNEIHVSKVLAGITDKFCQKDGHAFLGVTRTGESYSYALYLEKEMLPRDCDEDRLMACLDNGLNKNYHYLHSRRMGQLSRPGLALLDKSQVEDYIRLKGVGRTQSTIKFSSLETDFVLLAKLNVELKWDSHEEVTDYSA